MRTVKHWHRFPDMLWMSILGIIQGQVGQGFEQPDLAEDISAYCRKIGLEGL